MIGKFLDFFRTMFVKPKKDEKSFDVDLIREWEGLRLEAYLDTGGVWTIGYGHTKTAKQGMVISKQQAEDLLWQDVEWADKAVKALVNVPLNHNQRSALVSFVYNIGTTQFRNSTLLRKLNKGDYQGASKEFLRWTYDNGKFIQGLKNRRRAELKRFLDGDRQT